MRSPQIFTIVIIITPVIRPMRRISTCFSVKQVQKVNSIILFNFFNLWRVKIRSQSLFCIFLVQRKCDFVLICLRGWWHCWLFWFFNAHVWNYCWNFLFYFERVFQKRFFLWLSLVLNSCWIKYFQWITNELFINFLGQILHKFKRFLFKELLFINTFRWNDRLLSRLKRRSLDTDWFLNFFKTFLQLTNHLICLSTITHRRWLNWDWFWRRWFSINRFLLSNLFWKFEQRIFLDSKRINLCVDLLHELV